MDHTASRAKCHAGARPLERRVRRRWPCCALGGRSFHALQSVPTVNGFRISPDSWAQQKLRPNSFMSRRRTGGEAATETKKTLRPSNSCSKTLMHSDGRPRVDPETTAPCLVDQKSSGKSVAMRACTVAAEPSGSAKFDTHRCSGGASGLARYRSK